MGWGTSTWVPHRINQINIYLLKLKNMIKSIGYDTYNHNGHVEAEDIPTGSDHY